MRKQQNEFVSVVKKEQPKLLRYVRQKLIGISDMDAEDIVADVLFNVYNRITTDNQVENLAAYLYQSVKHKIWDRFRQRETPLSLNALDRDTGLPWGENLIDLASDVASQVEKKEFILRVKSALLQLDPKQRAVWIATELDGYSFKELSIKWGEPIGTLLSRKSRATQALRKLLQEE